MMTVKYYKEKDAKGTEGKVKKDGSKRKRNLEPGSERREKQN